MYICKQCGEEEKGSWKHIGIEQKGQCFGCHFWEGHAAHASAPESVRVGGEHFHIGPETAGRSAFLGFGGRRFKISFHDGRFVETRNLWRQGDIPAYWREKLPDNADFVQED
jgi:hypothetical protein